MNEFNEKTHAYIAAKFYHYLKEQFGERGVAAFIHATQLYAQQRGSRMAQRAIRDGKPLNFATYQEYGEWKPTQYAIDHDCTNLSVVEEWSPDLKTRILRCPWHDEFQQLGMQEAGDVYCQYLDRSICRGFNPDITYEVTQNLNSADSCIHVVHEAGFQDGENHRRHEQYVKDFEYHCAHSFWTYAKVTSAIFLSDGGSVIQNVIDDFSNDYSRGMLGRLMKYQNTDFNFCNCSEAIR
ncbi:MAG: L-2-amino-thiazoline-4-carboxylic acid hydrolase [Galactobacillus timonensis]|uniref:L-2-amino-thiazoline-4-carboxylic acid hydrolase n=1 Tax=Galactobacillus timonensis TaxID=2041840 RepID=UPI002409F298|nr:L-2-amino-thiazoline-4-carboxylic acid hydrolase [Galactobacillus timonensis]MDD6600761.1 L-2-amino-thiazoline-4-carboxylic acid hydrolase [Galactobacillus timonensis]